MGRKVVGPEEVWGTLVICWGCLQLSWGPAAPGMGGVSAGGDVCVLGSLRGDRASVPASSPLLGGPAGACVISFALRNAGFVCGDIT